MLLLSLSHYPTIPLSHGHVRQVGSDAFKPGVGQLIHQRAVKVNGLYSTLQRPDTHRTERHISEGRALKRHILQRWQVKLDADKGLPIESLSAQVGMVEVHAEKGTAFKGDFSQVVRSKFDICQLDADEFCSVHPRSAEGGSYQDGFTKVRIRKISCAKGAVCQICALKIGLT